MYIVKPKNLACPLDGKRLEARENQLVCENGHAFDIARQGYVNLLPVQHKRSKQPGDSKAMVRARTDFLNSGYYAPLATRLAAMVSAYIKDQTEVCLLDAGCGEGYYFDQLSNHLQSLPTDNHFCCIGLDISKDAIAEAAKRSRQISWIVGSNRQPPLDAASVDIILCVFGFQSLDGFNKILKPGGKIILVDPGAGHLKELRDIIYAEVKLSAATDISAFVNAGYRLLNNQSLQFKIELLEPEHIHNLLIMTPHFYRATQERRDAAGRLQTLSLNVDVVIRVLEKPGTPLA